MKKPVTRKLRCAVYTRKSTEEGLDMEFNSLDAQREACESYVASQKAEGWVLVQDRYDDGGFSGGNLERPALKRLLADIEEGLVDIVVVYKIDRLSRSLICRVLRLTLLAPDIVEDILDGRQPAELQMGALLKRFPVEWEQQTRHLGLIQEVPERSPGLPHFTPPLRRQK